ncbi:mitochondrial RNA pseudouridine synthase rpusd4-like isoform X1 [Bombus vosnesenskii]|uniref:Mitochondrial RNA pseudouridine synthase rpusd4-like isoform X1 n=2 Tax=Bombus vosnesenskii TaxID=207650 RepID=A0A6J3LB86_9HYME|nr:mitochondrial RNA pseudouridine synthase rpusd4-like isoform X1 [Bombus vosnesenskii]
MLTLITRSYALKCAYTTATSCRKILKRNYMENHPYKHIHPWKSFRQFSDDLLNNIVYNKDGLIVLNKPYGIRRKSPDTSTIHIRNNLPNGIDYTLNDALPYIAKQLNYLNLTIVRCPEMYMSGITLLAADEYVHHAIELACARSHFQTNTYWIITVGIPKQLEGQTRLGMKVISNPQFKHRKIILTSSWSHNEEKYRKIKLLKTQYKVLSNSTLNLCSLIELKSSTHSKNALRVFATTYLYTPILGDNIYASRIQKIGNTYVRVDPFLSSPGLPKLDIRLLRLLNVRPNQQEIIPTHIHLKSIVLPQFFGETLTIEAPLMPPFDWTCKQLDFKYLMPIMSYKSQSAL